MYTKEKIILELDILQKVKSGIREILVLSEDKNLRKKADELLNLLENKPVVKIDSLYEMIEEKMKETKYSNSQLNVSLYLLYRKLVDQKISEKEALDTFERYMKEEEFNK